MSYGLSEELEEVHIKKKKKHTCEIAANEIAS